MAPVLRSRGSKKGVMITMAQRMRMPISQRTVRVSMATFSKVYPAPQAAAAISSIRRASQVDGFQDEEGAKVDMFRL